jgi:F-type H+-transporting ATPase subunit a
MHAIPNIEEAYWRPFSYFGLDHPLLYLTKETIFNTWMTLVVMILLCLLGRWFLTRKDSVGRYLLLSFCDSFVDLVTQTLGLFSYNHFLMVTGIFIFVLLCNWIAILPWAEEPTQDLNTTLAFGISVFAYKEFFTIKVHGIKAYIKDFLQPFFVMLPLNIIGHFSKIISMSFRLFGNIYGGFTITNIYATFINQSIIMQIIGLVSGLNFIMLGFFTLFEGLIQAFVFAMLSLTYLAIAIQEE